MGGPRVTDEAIERIYQLSDAGCSQTQIPAIICKEFGRTSLERTTVYRLLKKRPLTSSKPCVRRLYHRFEFTPVLSDRGYPIAWQERCQDCGEIKTE